MSGPHRPMASRAATRSTALVGSSCLAHAVVSAVLSSRRVSVLRWSTSQDLLTWSRDHRTRASGRRAVEVQPFYPGGQRGRAHPSVNEFGELRLDAVPLRGGGQGRGDICGEVGQGLVLGEVDLGRMLP